MPLLLTLKGTKYMDSEAEGNPKPSSKPLGSLGRDEMNLAEFPIALLTDRIPKDQKEAVYQDEIFDERTGRTLARKLTIQAGSRGLTTANDDEVILALIQITKTKNGFSNKKVEFTRFELINKLGWPNAGTSYDRIELALDRWTSVYLKYENAWRDNRTKAWTSPQGFHIIDNFKLNDSRTSGDQMELMPSYIVWNDVIFDSFQAGYLKPLDYDLCMGLRNSTAKRMYRFLDKRFHHKPDWLFDLKELAHEHIGMGRHYEGPAHLKRNLQPAIEELETVGFLEPLPKSERFPKDGKDWKIRLIQKSAVTITSHVLTNESESEPPALAIELTNRGVTKVTAADLVQKFPAPFIEAKIEEFDWEMTQPKQPKKPAGYLVKSISDGYAADPNFVSKAERERQAEAKRQADELATLERRRKQEIERNERRLAEQVKTYRQSQTPDQLAQLEADAIAQSSDETRRNLDEPAMKLFRKTLISRMVDDHIARLIQTEEKITEPA
jgi:Replication initiator protein A